MPLNFPSSPANNQTYTDTTTGVSYKYESQNGYWKAFSNTATLTTITFKSDNYTFAGNDAGSLVAMDASTDKTFTIPANSSVYFPVGSRIDVLRYGVGNVNIVITTDTLRSIDNARNLTSQYSAATILKTNNTEWLLLGDVGAV